MLEVLKLCLALQGLSHCRIIPACQENATVRSRQFIVFPFFNWSGIGWWAGIIKRQSGDKNKRVKVDGVRQPANFIVQYTDDSEGPHCLTLGKYGKWAFA